MVTKVGNVLLETKDHQELKAGDHIYIFLDEPILYEHHGIYAGNNRVIHFQNWIIETSLKAFAHGSVVRVAPRNYNYMGSMIPARYKGNDVVKRAQSKLGTGLYNLEKYNDEHFASWCKCGHYCSN